MINTIKFFNVTQNNRKEKDTHPDRNLSAKIGEEFVDIGGGWLKKNKNGATYLSIKLQDAWVDHNDSSKTRTGFSLVRDDELEKLVKELKSLRGESDNVPSETPNADEIPF